MHDHPFPAPAPGSGGLNDWRAGQAVTLRRGPLAGWKGRLMERRGESRWLVNLDGQQRGMFVALQAAELLLHPEEAGEPPRDGRPPFAPP
jgi:hypothetical protein